MQDEDGPDKKTTIALSINTSWNLVNFRSNLIMRLQREGFDVVALSPYDQHTDQLTAMGVRHIPIAIDSKGLSPFSDLRLFAQYLLAFRRLRPAAYLGWTIKPNIYGSLAARALQIPVINNISGLGTAFIRVNWLTKFVKALYRLALARSATVFFQNRHDRELFVEQKLVRPSVAALLPGSGIDLDYFRPRGPGPTGEPFIFLLIARLLRDKGVAEFVEAARIVRQSCQSVEFDVLGSLDSANRTAIDRKTVEAWQSEGAIRYLGDASDVRDYIAGAGAVVLPSYREGMPRSLLEAAAMAKPLIASDVPGCTEIARAGENAFLCQPRDARSLADAMMALLDVDVTERARMGERSRQIAEKEFDVAVVEARYLAAIARVIDPGIRHTHRTR